MRDVFISGAAAVSAAGFDWRTLGDAVMAGTPLAREVAPIPAGIDADARSRKLMSHPARLAAVALHLALGDAAWPLDAREEIAFYLGVGASGCSMDELNRMLAASIEARAFSQERFGGEGLAACNPLFAFQLMNNFTLCHGAILHGTGGPNGAFYSRGTGTLAALAEAHWLVASGECERALAGGADSALHPVTGAQLAREGYIERGLAPSEGAGLLALAASAVGAAARLEKAAFHRACGPLQLQLPECGRDDLIVLAPWGNGARKGMRDALGGTRATVVDAGACLGESLAAAPALAWCAALGLLQRRMWRRAFVLSAGIDGGCGLAVLGSVA